MSEAALRDLTREVASEVEERADASWLWKGLHAKLIDGFTFTMPDTEKNQAEYPHPKTQKPGVGLPIARCTTIVSLATAGLVDAAIGPYKGKETGEPALLRSIVGSLLPGDVAVMDRCFSLLFHCLESLGGVAHSSKSQMGDPTPDQEKGNRSNQGCCIFTFYGVVNERNCQNHGKPPSGSASAAKVAYLALHASVVCVDCCLHDCLQTLLDEKQPRSRSAPAMRAETLV